MAECIEKTIQRNHCNFRKKKVLYIVWKVSLNYEVLRETRPIHLVMYVTNIRTLQQKHLKAERHALSILDSWSNRALNNSPKGINVQTSDRRFKCFLTMKHPVAPESIMERLDGGLGAPGGWSCSLSRWSRRWRCNCCWRDSAEAAVLSKRSKRRLRWRMAVSSSKVSSGLNLKIGFDFGMRSEWL